MSEKKRLFLSDENKVIAGVCGGVGEYFDMDPTVIRIIWAVLIFALGTGFLAYIIAWIVMPRRRRQF